MNKHRYNFIDLTGEKFNNLKVVKRVDDARKGTFWLCKCDCGNDKIVESRYLRMGLTKSCGCIKHKNSVNFTDLTGKRYGKLVVLKRANDYISPSSNHSTNWLCKCDCGKFCTVVSSSLKSGYTSSCGCVSKQSSKERATSHNLSKTRIYKLYYSMRARCNNPKNISYKKYGAKGIKVCDEWLGKDGFMNFYNWAMANGYNDKLTIDRIDNEKGYSPNNCRWATYKQQANNTRSTVFLTINGVTKPASEWADISGVSQCTITHRKKRGLNDDDCIK